MRISNWHVHCYLPSMVGYHFYMFFMDDDYTSWRGRHTGSSHLQKHFWSVQDDLWSNQSQRFHNLATVSCKLFYIMKAFCEIILGWLRELSQVESDGVASVITRPPEIVLCLKISIASQDVFIIFDSHPRPSHPLGSGFILNSSVEATAAYLEELLSIDPNILSDPSLHWQAELLGVFAGHILVRKAGAIYDPDIDFILMDASTKILSLMAEVADLKRQQLSLSADNEYLTQRLVQVEQSRVEVSRKGKSRIIESGTSSGSAGTRSTPRSYTEPKLALQGSSSKGNSSEDAAKKMQAEFDEEDRKLTFERTKLLKYRTFECRVCFEVYAQDHVAPLDACDHSFCRNCLRQYVTMKIEDRRYPIPCPACVAENVKPTSECSRYVWLSDIVNSRITWQVLRKLSYRH